MDEKLHPEKVSEEIILEIMKEFCIKRMAEHITNVILTQTEDIGEPKGLYIPMVD